MDTLTSWRTPDGKEAQPLLVASTATARNASDQVRALYGRYVTIFPPQVLDAGRTFFSREIPVSEEKPGRRYIGISTTGIRLTTAEIRVSEVLMAAGQHLLDTAGDTAADPYMTLVGYFSSIRELAGMSRYMNDDIQTTLAETAPVVATAVPVWHRLRGSQRGGADVAGLQRGHHRDPGRDGRVVPS